MKYKLPGPRPLKYSLEDYYLAHSGEGPLAAEWTDKPHRLLYDLIAALNPDSSARSMKLFIVSQRHPMLHRARTVQVHRFVVLATSVDEAIEKVKAKALPEKMPMLDRCFWSGRPCSGDVWPTFTDTCEPTTADLEEQKRRFG